MPAVRVLLDTVYTIRVRLPSESDPMESGEALERRAVVQCGGLLYQTVDGHIHAMQPQMVCASFDRCFDDGRQICGLDESVAQQASAIRAASVNMKERVIDEMRSIQFASLEEFLSREVRQEKMFGAACEHIRRWTAALHAHARDLNGMREEVYRDKGKTLG